MKNFEIGIDIVETKRIKLNKLFIDKILHINEIIILNTKDSKKEKIQFLAGRWAVKEAICKSIPKSEIFSNMNIYYKNNKPQIILKKYNLAISISHEKKYAVGSCLRFL